MNGYNYRTLNPWEQTALEHLSAMIGEIIGGGFEDPNCLMERVNDMVLELSYWKDATNINYETTNIYRVSGNSPADPTNDKETIELLGICDEEIAELLDIHGDQEINPS